MDPVAIQTLLTSAALTEVTIGLRRVAVMEFDDLDWEIVKAEKSPSKEYRSRSSTRRSLMLPSRWLH